MSNTDFLWTEFYRPKNIDDCILPEETKKVFKGFVEQGEIPNLLFCGPPGVGKTTVAKALCNEMGLDCYVINGSDEGRFLDTVRNQARNFASTVSLYNQGKHKVIIIDEADNTGNDVQMLLRASIEEFSQNCRFIFTCNYKNKILDALHSRCSVIEFSLKGKEKSIIAKQLFDRLKEILDERKIQYQDAVLVEIIKKHFPDFRRVLNECQSYSVNGKIDSAILASFSDVSIDKLINKLKNKEFLEVRKWVVSNLDNDINTIIRKIYDSLYTNLEPSSIPVAILIIAKYQYQAAFVADQEINLLAALTEIMGDCKFK